MKDKILYLLIGLLIGAIIVAGIFIVLDRNKTSNEMEKMGQGSRMGTPPNGEMMMPEDNNGTNGIEAPPIMSEQNKIGNIV